MFPERLELESAGRRVAYVLRRDATLADAPEGAVAVYENTSGGGLVYPTGLIWVRFAKGTDVHGRTADLARAGYRMERSPKYAPHGAWLSAQDPAFALAHLDALRAIEGVELVEPQMLSRASLR